MDTSWLDRPDKTEEAKGTFEEIRDCIYTGKQLGNLGQAEHMLCQCSEEWLAKGKRNMACGERLGCINRATLVECIDGGACGDRCRNQRFQRHQYAPLAVVDAGQKGYGVRAQAAIKQGTFIYEYIGEVIPEDEFRQRMVAYDAAKIKHFYFMMLSHNAFIDATKKGLLARFCNHLCEPNAFVDKWVVGPKLRMGIFAKRDIAAGEEITFDYNVDRYGAALQPCYCGAPSCMGYMGGKTQTDAALLLPDAVAAALGVTPKMERQWLREHKHLRNEKDSDVVNTQFINDVDVRALADDAEVLKVMLALMTSKELPLVRKLVARVAILPDDEIQRRVMLLHGYQTFSVLLGQFGDDHPLVHQILEVMLAWPRATKNKISSLKIEEVVKHIAEALPDAGNREVAAQLLEEWSKLQMAYRIPKAARGSLVSFYDRETQLPSEEAEHNTAVAARSESPALDADTPLPPGWELAIDPASNKPYYFNRSTNVTVWDRPLPLPAPEIPTGPKKALPVAPKGHEPLPRPERKDRKDRKQEMRDEGKRLMKERMAHQKTLQQRESELKAMIAKAQEELVRREEARRAEEEQRLAAKREKHRLMAQGKKGKATPQQQWVRVLAKHVPNMIRKYELEVGHDNIKGCGRDIVNQLAEKEVKKGNEPPAELDDKRLKKMKVYSKEFMDKFRKKLAAKKHRRRATDNGDEPPAKRAKPDA